MTPLDFGPQENVEVLKENLKKYGWNVLSTWAMGDDLETLQKAGKATVNLVMSAVGMRAAKVLWERYKIPYVIGTPNQWLAEDISNALETAIARCTAETQQSVTTQQSTIEQYSTVTDGASAAQQADPAALYLQNRMQQNAEITLIGEPVTMGSLAAGIEKKYGHSTRVFCPLKGCEALLGKKDKVVLGEEAMEEALKDSKIIVADPLYRPICPKSSTFYELPHVAFSGRIYL